MPINSHESAELERFKAWEAEGMNWVHTNDGGNAFEVWKAARAATLMECAIHADTSFRTSAMIAEDFREAIRLS